ncbi:hypothetical protein FACS1894122_14620 [Alphaproteobacteria bacterium]|nr:hypothetical protein FACS1894122_14620 [Alphaproteobacteria bacterium]
MNLYPIGSVRAAQALSNKHSSCNDRQWCDQSGYVATNEKIALANRAIAEGRNMWTIIGLPSSEDVNISKTRNPTTEHKVTAIPSKSIALIKKRQYCGQFGYAAANSTNAAAMNMPPNT